MVRYRIFGRPICPSACALLQNVVSAVWTACRFCAKLAAKVSNAATPQVRVSRSYPPSSPTGSASWSPSRPQARISFVNRCVKSTTRATSASCRIRVRSAAAWDGNVVMVRTVVQANCFGEASGFGLRTFARVEPAPDNHLWVMFRSGGVPRSAM